MKINFKKLFIEETNNTMLQFFRYIFVGGTAFVADFFVFFIFDHILKFELALSVAISFLTGIYVNYILSKWIVFKKEYSSKLYEITIFIIIGVIGLGLTELLMHLFTSNLNIHSLISKVIVSAIVLIWNFTARKIILYKK